MNDTQKVLFELLCEFDEICKSNKIEYMLSGGGLLGAVRNRGFLPWDDDVDVRIKRSEFERLDAVMSKQKSKDRAWVTDFNTPDYNNPIARYFNLNTTLIYPGSLTMDVPKGHTVEIFILDPIPAEPDRKTEFFQKLWLYSELRNEYLTYTNIDMPAVVSDEKLYYAYKTRIEKEGMETVADELYSFFTAFPEKTAETWCGRAGNAFHLFDDEIVKANACLSFEGRDFPVATKYLDHLRCSFGYNWNIVPERSARRTHSSIESCKISFSEKADEVERIARDGDYDATQKILKDRRVKRVFIRKQLQKCEADKTILLLNEVVRVLENEKKAWRYEDFNNPRYKEAFVRVRSALVSKRFKRLNIAVPIRDDILAVILWNLLDADRIDDALNVVSLYPESEVAAKFKTVSELISDAKLYKYYGDTEACKKTIKELSNYVSTYRADGQPEIKRIKLRLKSEAGAIGLRDIGKLKKDSFYRRDAESLKYIADAYDQLGKREIAKRLYAYVSGKTNNGMLIQSLRDEGHYYNKKQYLPPFVTEKAWELTRRKLSAIRTVTDRKNGDSILNYVSQEKIMTELKTIDDQLEKKREELEMVTREIDGLREKQDATLKRVRELFE